LYLHLLIDSDIHLQVFPRSFVLLISAQADNYLNRGITVKSPAVKTRMIASTMAGFRAPTGHPDQCFVGISSILLCRAWSKLDMQVVVCNCSGDPFKAWVAGSIPAALAKIFQSLTQG
jgi:hypothetical protein